MFCPYKSRRAASRCVVVSPRTVRFIGLWAQSWSHLGRSPVYSFRAGLQVIFMFVVVVVWRPFGARTVFGGLIARIG